MITVKLKKSIVPVIISLCALILLFKMPDTVASGVKSGLEICLYTLLPSLFPFTVLCIYIVKANPFSPLYKFFAPATRLLFKQPPVAAPVIFMSLIGGFPIGAKMTSELYENGQLTKNQAQRLCLFCFNSGPAFAMGAVGASVLHSRRAGVILYASLCLSAVCAGILTSFIAEESEDMPIYNPKNTVLPLAALTSAVSDGLKTMGVIFGWVLLFGGVGSLIGTLNIPKGLNFFLLDLSEVSVGCAKTAAELPLPVTAAVISFGGLCVHCQVLGFISKTELKYSRFFAVRVFCAALSALYCHLLLKVFPVELSVFSQVQGINTVPFSSSVTAFLAFGLTLIIFAFDVDRKKKLW